MNSKKRLTVILSFLIIFSLTSCHSNNSVNTSPESTTDNSIKTTDKIASEDMSAILTAVYTDTSETAVNITTTVFDNPTDWSTEQIIDFYKNAAEKSNSSVKSRQNIEIKSISVNNGEYEGLFEFITPIMSKFIENNSEDKNGITGGYGKLDASDVASAKAYKVGNNIAVEMIMKEQVSGAREDALEGSVGHAISTVGDITVVTNQLKDLGLPLEVSEENTEIYYTKPVIRVIINSNGEIVNGTWSYTVEIKLNNYKAFGKAVNTTSVIMDNTITVNGGFKK